MIWPVDTPTISTAQGSGQRSLQLGVQGAVDLKKDVANHSSSNVSSGSNLGKQSSSQVSAKVLPYGRTIHVPAKQTILERLTSSNN